MRSPTSLAIAVLVAGAMLTGAARADPAPPTFAEARARAARDVAGKLALQSLAALRAAAKRGVGLDYRQKLQAYTEDRDSVRAMDASSDPGAKAADAAYSAAMDDYIEAASALKADDPTRKARLQALDARADAARVAMYAAEDAAAAKRDVFAAPGQPLPDPASPALWARGQTGPVPHTARPVKPTTAFETARGLARARLKAPLATQSLAQLRQARAVGDPEQQGEALGAYCQDWVSLAGDLWDQTELDPILARAKRAREAAERAYQVALATPSTSDADLWAAAIRKNQAPGAYRAAHDAATVRALAHLGFDLPDPRSLEDPRNQQADFRQPCIPPPVGLYGASSTPFKGAPWQVELQWTTAPTASAVRLHRCGGALIRADWMVTAAHCVWDERTSGIMPYWKLRVRTGSSRLSDNMQQGAIDQVYVPNGKWRFADGPRTYEISTRTAPSRNDIALIHFTPAAQLSGPDAPTPIEVATPALGEPVVMPQGLTISGWGAETPVSYAHQQLAGSGGLQMAPTLQVADLNEYSNPDCSKLITERVRTVHRDAPAVALPATAMCAGTIGPAESIGPTGTCTGDSGGPLVAHTVDETNLVTKQKVAGRPVLVGLVSWGAGCDGVTVFTRVSAFSDWIDATIAAHEPPAPAVARRPG